MRTPLLLRLVIHARAEMPLRVLLLLSYAVAGYAIALAPWPWWRAALAFAVGAQAWSQAAHDARDHRWWRDECDALLGRLAAAQAVDSTHDEGAN